jgi:acetyl esterase/lipase
MTWRGLAALAMITLTTAAAGVRAAEPMTLKDYRALNGPEPTAHIGYGPAPRQYVEVFEPPGRGPFPVAVLIHGGCFYNKYEGMAQLRGMAGALKAHGVAVWSIEYRGLETPGGGYPGTFQDINAAMASLADRARSLHIDTQRIVVVGHSAGAYLALWVGGRQNIPVSSPLHVAHPLRVREVVALGGSGDIHPDIPSFRQPCGLELGALTGSPTPSHPDVYADTSPASLLPDGAHTVFINGEVDNIAAPANSAAYAARVRAAGDKATAIVISHASHYDEPAVTSPAWSVVLPVILAAVGKGPAAP